MVIRRFSTGLRRGFLLGTSSLFILSYPALAGFQWVPAPAPITQPEVVMPMPPAEELESPAPVVTAAPMATQPVTTAPATAQPVEKAPVSIISNAPDIEGLESPETLLTPPAQIEASAPVSTPAQEPLPISKQPGTLKTIDLTTPREQLAPPPIESIPDPIASAPPPVQIQQFEIQERITKTPTVIMPTDAPKSALAHTIGSRRLKQNNDTISSQHVSSAAVEQTTMPEETPIEPITAPAATAIKSHPLLKAAGMDHTHAIGFGTDMPLAIALGQVVPSNYAYSFAPGINPGAKVSWNGGKPWVDVIEEMLAPLNLTAVIRGNAVHVTAAPNTLGALDLENEPSIEVSALLDEFTAEDQEEQPDFDAETLLEEANMQDKDAPSRRSHIQDPGKFEAAQQPDTVTHIERLTGTLETEPTEIETAAVETPQKKKLEISPHPLASSPLIEAEKPLEPQESPAPVSASTHSAHEDKNTNSANLYASYNRAPPPPAIEDIDVSSLLTQKDTQDPAIQAQPVQDVSMEPLEKEQTAPLMASTEPSTYRPAIDASAKPVQSPTIIEPQKISESKKEALLAGGAPISVSKIRFWEAKQGESLKKTLSAWSTKANTTLVWNASEDYIIKSNILVSDTFQNAIQKIYQRVLEDPEGPYLELISEGGSAAPSRLVISDRS